MRVSSASPALLGAPRAGPRGFLGHLPEAEGRKPLERVAAMPLAPALRRTLGTRSSGVPEAPGGGDTVLDDRKLGVLRAIVEDFVSTNEPVGSKSLVEKHQLGVSPA